MKRYISLLLFSLVYFTCSGRGEFNSNSKDNYCEPVEIEAEELNNCIHIHWVCEGGKRPDFILSRKTEYSNSTLKEERFIPETDTYTDCSIKKGLNYTYTLYSDKNNNSISTTIKTEPIKDFEIKIVSNRVTGRLLEILLQYTPLTDNPYDMSKLDITMQLIKPDGSNDEAKGFFMTEYDIEENEEGKERFIKGENKLKIRYNPEMIGTYIAYFTIKDEEKILYSGYYPIEVSRERERDYIKVSSKNPLYFATENERLFFPIGFNIGWARYNGLFEFQAYIDKMQKAGSNLFRMWMIKWSNAIEWSKGNGSGDYNGLMRYAQDNAARIDKILSYAEEKGVKIMLTFGSYLEFTEGGHWDEGSWRENPYNMANGGMCKESSDFFEMDEAKRIYKNRLRYISARWGYSTSIFAYEFFNETNAPFEWVSEMSAFLKKTDYNRHIISTTYGDDRIFGLKNIDFTMMHLYGNPPELIKDYPRRVNEITTQFVTKYKKPFLLAEFGLDWSKSDYEYDKDGLGINFHNGVFAAISSGSAGTAMLWWWDDYIDRLNLYKILSPVKTIIDEFGDFWGVKQIDTNTLTYSKENLTAFGVASDNKFLLWIQNRESNWYNEYNKKDFNSVNGEISVQNLKINCKALVKIFDTWDGRVINNFTANVDGKFEYSFENLKRDIVLVAKCEQ